MGRCPDCGGSGNIVDGRFLKLCSRCSGSGKAKLSGKEHDDEFARGANAGYQKAEQNRAAGAGLSGGNRPFESGMDPDTIRARRDEIRRMEGRPVPAGEPRAEDANAVTVTVGDDAVTAGDARKCPCGMAVGECSGCCC